MIKHIPIVLLFRLLPVSDVEAVAALLKRFLGLEELKLRRQQEEEAEFGEEEEEDSLDNSSDDEDQLWSLCDLQPCGNFRWIELGALWHY